MTLNIILMTPALTSCLIFLFFSFSILYCSPDFFSCHVFRQNLTCSIKIFAHMFLHPFCIAYSRRPFVLSCSKPVCRRRSHMQSKNRRTNQTVWRNSLGAIYSLGMIYCTLVNYLLSTYGNDMCIACSVILCLCSSLPRLDVLC